MSATAVRHSVKYIAALFSRWYIPPDTSAPWQPACTSLADITEVFKLFKGHEDISYNIYFTSSQSGFRGHSYNEVPIRMARRANRCRSIRTASKVGLGLWLVYRVRVGFLLKSMTTGNRYCIVHAYSAKTLTIVQSPSLSRISCPHILT